MSQPGSELSDDALLRLAGLLKSSLALQAHGKIESADPKEIANIEEQASVGSALASDGGNIDDFGKLSRYELF